MHTNSIDGHKKHNPGQASNFKVNSVLRGEGSKGRKGNNYDMIERGSAGEGSHLR